MKITAAQRKALEHLWFVYGNEGIRHTWGNHKFIQILLERGEDDREFFRQQPSQRFKNFKPLTKECEEAVDAILSYELEDGDTIDNHICGDRSEL